MRVPIPSGNALYWEPMAKKRPQPKRSRTVRREAERTGVRLAEARLELASLEVGGAPDRPISVVSASIIEPHAAGLECAACGGRVRVEEHSAVTTPGESGAPRSLRVVRVRCTRCSVVRNIYFEIAKSLPN